MDKRSFFIEALQSGAYKYKEWIISAFTVTDGFDDSTETMDPANQNEYTIAKKANIQDYPYKILRLSDKKGYCFKDPVDNDTIIELEGTDINQPLFSLKERILLKAGDLENVDMDIDTLYGNALINAIIFIYPFGSKIPFMTGRLTGGRLDAYISERLHDTPQEGESRDDKKLYVDEYVKYATAVSSLAGLALLGVPAGSPKLLTINPKIRQRRDELFKEYADKLHDPAYVAKIESELVQMDKEDFKGDISEGFLIKSNNFDVSRKRAKIMHGIETGFGDNSKGVNPIRTSLAEKWDIKNLPSMVDSLRAGSYNRGHQTALGGESVKFFYRVYQNTRVLEKDCGVKTGLLWRITENNYKTFTGLYTVADPDSALTESFVKTQIGKQLLIRTPMLCKTKAPSFCERCVGDKIAMSPTGVHIAMSDVGSIFMLSYMKAMHGKALKTAFYDYNTSIT